MPLSWRWLYNLQTQTFLSEVEWRKENHKLKCVSLGEVFWGKDKHGERREWSSAYRNSECLSGAGEWGGCEWRKGIFRGKRAFHAKKKMKLELTLKWLGMCLSNFKLSLTRAMETGKVGTLRSCDELVENANWQRQVREYLGKQNQTRAEGHGDLLPSVWKESACLLTLPNSFKETWRNGHRQRKDSQMWVCPPEAKRLPSSHTIDASPGEGATV